MLNILFWHGYNLSGSGSNVFALNISRELSKSNNVFLMCQEDSFKDYECIKEAEFLDEYTNTKQLKLLHFNSNNLTAIKPHIGEILPVFVIDKYKDFVVKSFLDLDDCELENYISMNVNSVKSIINRYSIDLIICNHLVISPLIMSMAADESKTPFITVGHGSSLNYIIAHSKKYLDLSYKGLMDSKAIILQSNYFYERAMEIYEDVDTNDSIRSKIKIIPSGVDIENFQNEISEGEFEDMARINQKSSSGFYRSMIDEIISTYASSSSEEYKDCIEHLTKYLDYKDLDRDFIEHIDFFNRKKDDIVISFVGKLIISKGVQVFLMGLPYLFSKHEKLKIAIVGFGKFRLPLETMVRALRNGDIDYIRRVCEEGYIFEDLGQKTNLHYVASFLEKLKREGSLDEYISLAAKIPEESILFTGNMNHDMLPYVLQKSDINVTPSIFPESFGMVAVEAMSCGCIPVAFNHSGLKDVIPKDENLAELDENAVFNLNEKLLRAIDEVISNPYYGDYYVDYSKRFSFNNISEEILDYSKNFTVSKSHLIEN